MTLLEQLYNLLLSPALITCILIAGIYTTVRLGHWFIRHPIRVCKELIGGTQGGSSLSSWKALTVALAGTLGVGNIAGVASAIALGGPGAVFWMWVGALLSMTVKFSEVVLAIRYRKPSSDGYAGGAMYYFSQPILGTVFASLCLFASFTLGNILQARTVAVTLEEAFGLSPILCGILMAILLYLTICKGFSRISSVTLCLVPIMSLVYILLCGIVIGQNLSAIPGVFREIFVSAFKPSAVLGGAGGLTLAQVIRTGISRGLITHEAGCGTAPIAHAEAQTNSPVRQGFLGIFEVFADTIILCTLTALVLLIHRDRPRSSDGMDAVIASFSQTFGGFAPPILALLVFCFALATMIGWSYYGKRCLDYLTQRLSHPQIYKKLYATAYSFLSIIGVMTASKLMWILADYSVACMTLLHIPSLLPKIGEVAMLTRQHFQRK